MLVLYYNLLHNKVSQYLSSFLPNTSLATNRYPISIQDCNLLFIRMFFSQTCKYNLPVLINSISSLSDELTDIVRNADSTSLSGIKKQQNVICLLNTRMSVLFQIATFVSFNYFKARCFVLCATIVVPNILVLCMRIDC